MLAEKRGPGLINEYAKKGLTPQQVSELTGESVESICQIEQLSKQ